MTNLLQRVQPRESYDEAFFESTRDLLAGWTKGNMIPFQYSHPLSPDDLVRGALLWEEFAAIHQGYYQSYESGPLIQKACAELPDVLGHPIDTLVDIGPGPTRSIEMKTAKLLAALSPATYRPTDVALPYLENAKAYVEKNYPHIKTEPTVLNIMEPTSADATGENAFYFLDGSTLLNIPQDEDTPDVSVGLIRNFKNIRHLMADNAYLAFVHDTNQDERSLHRLYRHPVQDAFIMNVLYRIVRDLPISGFDPSAFSYELAWLPEQHLVAHRAVATKNQSIVLGDIKMMLSEGEKLQLTHSYKLPEPQVILAAQEAGFHHVKSWDDGNKRLVFQLFRAAPQGE